MNVPQLRFSGFDGEWETKTIFELIESGTVIQHIDGNHGELYPRADEFVEYGVPYVSANSLSNGKIDYTRVKYLSESRADKMKKGVSQPGDVLFAHNATVGPVGIVDRKFSKVILSTTLTLYRFNENLMNNFFVKSFMESDKYIQQYSNVMKQTTRNQVPITMQRSFRFPNIDLEEQNKVANFFNLIDKRIEKQEEKIEKLEHFKKGMMQKIFSQQLRFKDEDGEEFPEWEVCRLGELSDVRDGTHDTPKYVPTGYPLITSKNLNKNGNIVWSDISYISEFDYNEINKRSNVETGDILFGMIGTIGNPIRVKISDFAIKNVALIKETGSLLNQYLIHYLKSSNLDKQFHIQQAGGTQKFIGLGQIRNLEINVPINSEQLKISSYLDALTRKVDLENEKLIALEEQKKGFMQKMFV